MPDSVVLPVRICVISTGDASRNPRLPSLVETLRRSGNDVCVVSGPLRYPLPQDLVTHVVPARIPARGTRFARNIRRLLPAGFQSRLFRRRIIAAARQTGAMLFYPLARRDIESAQISAGSTGGVFHPPGWGAVSARDVSELAPHDSRWSASPCGQGLPLHTEHPEGLGSIPEPARHRGRRIVLVYRGTQTSPGRYLHSALERAGVLVERLEGTVDYNRIPSTTDAVVVVESPYPAFAVSGTKTNVPMLFWVHHGEHHLDANVRLAERYGADAILLAHSWHLAHRFAVPVHRFPFGVAPEISGSGASFEQRQYDVAMVAAGLTHEGGSYSSRQAMARSLVDAFPDRSRFAYGLVPEELGALYRDSRVVPNDGGTNHHPITMRVFEAIGNGARLLTEDAPGMDCLFDPDRHYVTLSQDPVADTLSILGDQSAGSAAAQARHFAVHHHSYDHRVDELFSIVGASTVSRFPLSQAAIGTLAGMIDEDPEIQVIVDFGNNDLSDLLPTREIRDGGGNKDILRPRSVDAVVLGPNPLDRIDVLIAAARLHIYAVADAVEPTISAVVASVPAAEIVRQGNVVRIVLGLGGYRQRQPGHPLA